MSAYRTQAHIDAPLEDVWALVGNPATYPEWWPVAVEIRGAMSAYRAQAHIDAPLEDVWWSGWPEDGWSTAGSSNVARSSRS